MTNCIPYLFATTLFAASVILPTSRVQAADEASPQRKRELKIEVTKKTERCAAANNDQNDPYDTLYDLLMTRWKDGKPYAQNETSPAIFAWSEFPFDDKTFKKLNAALDSCLALSRHEIEQYGAVKRALLQRHLWNVFDTTFDWDWWREGLGWAGRTRFPKKHMPRRKALQPKIASLMRRLALTKKEILALPNPMGATVKSGRFARAYDPTKPFRPFLPDDLYYGKQSSWICLGEDQHPIPATAHTGKLHSRSVFLVFMRLPGGRDKTLEYMLRIKKEPLPFPVGTQFALIEQPFLISKKGKLHLSPMVVSVQLRAYLDIKRRFLYSDNKATQCVAEFVMQPGELMIGNAVMKAMGRDEFRYQAGAPSSAGFSPRDPFAEGDIATRLPTTPRLKSCMSCHGRKGSRGIRTRSFQVTKFFFKETSVENISNATSAGKRDNRSWKRLKELWRVKPILDVDIDKLIPSQPKAR